mgnify:CR=1 FL=1
MLPLHTVERFLQHTPPGLQEVVGGVGNLIAVAAPEASEIIQWGGLSYYDARRGGTVSAGICQIGLQRDHVQLAFIHGAFLPDPKGLLQGGRRYKRFVKITSYDAAPWDDLKDLVRASAGFDPRTLQIGGG